jgi:hypothetical protein
MAATPLLRARTFDLTVIPPQLPQPPPEQDERAWERAEDAAPRAGTVQRRALCPDRVLKPFLQHYSIVVLVRHRIRGNYVRERSGAHGREELEDLGFFVDGGRVAGGRDRTYPTGRELC